MSDIAALQARYDAFRARGLRLDMSRGKPEARQLDLSLPMLRATDEGFLCEDGVDARNYGDPTGIPEAKRLFGALLGMLEAQVIVGGNSSVNLIYDALVRAILHGPLPGDAPWKDADRVRFICPVPGYDWHFHMLCMLGIECVPVPIVEGGPDMDAVERLARDPAVKGIICVPMYANPSGTTFSDETVRRLARMETAATDFRIFWDNAYCVHHLYADRRDHLLNLYKACSEAGTEDRALLFTSTSKITFAGGGVGAMAASPRNIERQAGLMLYQMVCYDKVNQLRHARFLPDMAAVERHMARHADILRPKFELVLEALDRELAGCGTWSRPLGGYFICYRAPKGCARRIVELCANAGVTLTPAGAPFPGGYDPEDSVVRIAPTYPPLEELEQVMELFPVAVQLAAAGR
ncbi:MAG TPA: aminotransferase class I/II-fold pyridoxal phosphate-dependent enzyme [Candidatus Pullichristensenella avicola]|nr:aminotransferase class I/II-fold pyridoxal phosphate-dependent enzyme [Candidatus Pullichristensenella avicola]